MSTQIEIADQFRNELTGMSMTNQDLEELIEVVGHFVHLEQEIAEAEAALQKKRELLETIQMAQLPELFNQLGLRELKLKNGSYVRVRPFYSASVSDENPELKARALAWLRANEYESLIKNVVAVPLPPGNDKLAAEIKKFLDKRAIAYNTTEQVHNQTLKAFMKERIESGKAFPMDIFRGFAGSKATVEVPK